MTGNPRDDEPLSTPDPAPHIVDTSVELDPDTYDMDAHLDGIRPNRRTVTIHEQAHLVAVLDELANRIETEADDDRYNALVDKFDEVRARFLASVSYWTLEQRSTDWIRNRWDQFAGANGITLVDGKSPEYDGQLRLVIHQIAGQVVQVKDRAGNVTATSVDEQRLRDLYKANETEFAKITAAMNNANDSIAGAAGVLTRNFSRRSSTARSGTAS